MLLLVSVVRFALLPLIGQWLGMEANGRPPNENGDSSARRQVWPITLVNGGDARHR